MSQGFQESDQVRKIKLIKSINKIISVNRGILTTSEFETLYDLEIDELINIRFDLEKEYKYSEASEN